MLKNSVLAMASLFMIVFFSSMANAHPDKIDRVTEKMSIQAAASDVLSIVNQTDPKKAKRILTQKEDDSLRVIFIEIEYKKQPEELKNLKHIKYKIEVKDKANVFALSAGEYILKIKLSSKGNSTNVKWILEYEVGNRGTLTEAEKATKKLAVRNLMSEGLANLKSLAEK